ncbi:MAG: SRPBCC family protein [Bacteroidaceae bacterium]|nr:SRPBCC family protein [Bacteroidaceae bacterium]MDE7167163.1 SRPBCC family protein [Bacteroidaceae bacterium]
MTKYESSVKRIYAPVGNVYAKLSDLNNLAAIKERMADPAFEQVIRQQMGDKLNEGQLQQARDVVSRMQFDRDTATVEAGPVGSVSLRIVEREEPKLVKLQAENSPIPANLWIQLLPAGDGQAAMKVTLGVELNFFMKQMVKGKLKDAVERLADMLAMLPY